MTPRGEKRRGVPRRNAHRGQRRGSTGRRIIGLAIMAALAAVSLILSALFPILTGSSRWDGIIGVVLGLYICSLPARHFLDLLIYWRTEEARFTTRLELALWLALNGAVLLSGWLVIVVGATRFTAATR